MTALPPSLTHHIDRIVLPMAQVGILDLWHSTNISRFHFQSSVLMHTRSEDLRHFEGFSGSCVAHMSIW